MNRFLRLCLLSGQATMCVADSPWDESASTTRRRWVEPPELPCAAGTLGLRVRACGSDTLCVSYARPGGPAHSAGLRPNNRIVEAAGHTFDGSKAFHLFVKSHPPGHVLPLIIQTDSSEQKVEVPLTDIASLFSVMGDEREKPPIKTRYTRWNQHQDELERAALELTGRSKSSDLAAALRREFELGLAAYPADCRLGIVDFVLHHPLKSAQVADSMADEILAARNINDLISLAGRYLDLGDRIVIANADGPAADPLENILLARLTEAQELAKSAFAKISAVNRRRLTRVAPLLMDAIAKNVAMEPADKMELSIWEDAVRIAKRVDLDALANSAATLARVSQPEHRHQLRRWVASLPELPEEDNPPGVLGPLLIARETPGGWVLVGGPKANVYAVPAAAIIDIGGNDTYHSISTADIDDAKPLVELILDFAGNDRYFGTEFANPAAAIGGVSVLVDLAGHDVYNGGRLSLGSAFCGVGVLRDLKGDDVYAGAEFTQGTALFGIGILSDRSGSDQYMAPRFAQGFGSSRGFGLLHDGRGSDTYTADGDTPSSYGTPGVFEGWAQGVGCGLRGLSSGGIGSLVDGGGEDRYQVGNFGQGVGYFFGLGTLVDDRGDDRFFGSRYAQGAAAHQAVGVLIDRSGNDSYHGRVAASQAGAWDMAIAILQDRSGNDLYQADGFAQAASALTAIAILHDWHGTDRYSATSGQAHGDSRASCGTQGRENFAVLIDEGGSLDEYSITGRDNTVEAVFGKAGLFSDR